MNVDFQPVLDYFYRLTTIPRGSGNRAGIKAFLCDFAEKRGLSYRTDAADNVVIFKPAGKGYENKTPVILQGHSDMVCAAEASCDFDFLHDGLIVETNGDFLSARGTTLGADDGIAVAMMLALLESDRAFPALECLFTADEEIGMIGANALDMSDLKGNNLINIDSEDEGVLTVSCAGGSTALVTLPVQKELSSGKVFTLCVSGLAGGHSGVEIVKGGLNACKVLGEALHRLPQCRVVRLAGGEKENAIARQALAQVMVAEGIEVQRVADTLCKECLATEPNITITCTDEGDQTLPAMNRESSERITTALYAMPQGIVKMNPFDASAVQTSLNLGVMEQGENAVRFTFCLRSSVEAEREALEKELEIIAGKNGGNLAVEGIYPGWEYKEHSVLRDTAIAVFERLYGNKPKIEAIHAGLECGVLMAKKEGLDCISLGPQLFDVHTPRERMSLSSAARTWEYLQELIRRI